MFFDVDGTLVQMTVTPEEIWTAAVEGLGVPVEPDGVAAALKGADREVLPRMREYRDRRKDFWLAYTHDVLARLRVDDPAGERARAVQRAFDDDRWYRVWPEAPGVLAALRDSGQRLGVVSNNTDRLPRRLGALGLAPFFRDVTYSEEAGALKPDPAIFRIALRRAGCRPREVVHVGDEYDADVVGARGAGLAAVLVDRPGRRRRADCPRIRDLRGLPPLLAGGKL